MKFDPKLTVVLPAHNAEKTLAAAVRSVLVQTYADFELWILENGSNDSTLKIAREFLHDRRVRVFELGPVGFQGALEVALQNATTDWIGRMDADDISFPTRFEKQMSFLQSNPEYLFVGSAFAVMTQFGHIFTGRHRRASRPVRSESLDRSGEFGWFFADASVVFNRSAALEVGGYDPEFKMGDQPLWFRLLENGQGFELGEPLYVYRASPVSMNFGLYHNDAIRVRNKYLNRNYAVEPFDRIKRNNKYWYKTAVQELIAGNGKNVRDCAERLEGSGTHRRRFKLLCLSYIAILAPIYYKISRRSGWVHSPDLEREFVANMPNSV